MPKGAARPFTEDEEPRFYSRKLQDSLLVPEAAWRVPGACEIERKRDPLIDALARKGKDYGGETFEQKDRQIEREEAELCETKRGVF